MRVRVAICTPVKVLIYHAAPICALRAATLLDRAGFEHSYFQVPGSALLEHTRSLIADDALAWGAEVLLWVDDDITFAPEEAVKLVKAALETQSLVAGVCALRGGDRINVDPKNKDEKLQFYRGGRIIEVNHAGLGMTAVHRSVYDRLKQEWEPVIIFDKARIPYYRTRFWDGAWPGEDFSFTRLMRECGLQSYADTSVRAIHHGDYGWRIEDVIQQRMADAETLEVEHV